MSAINKLVQGTFGFGSILFGIVNVIFAVAWFGALVYSISLFRPSISNSYLWLLVPHGAAVMLFLNGIKVQPPEEKKPVTGETGRFAGYIRTFKIFWSPTLWAFGLFLVSILCTLLMLILYAFIWVACIIGIGTLDSAGTQACADERWLVWLNTAFALVFAIFALVGAAISLFQLWTINNIIKAVTGLLPSQMFGSAVQEQEQDETVEDIGGVTESQTVGSGTEYETQPEYYNPESGEFYKLPPGYHPKPTTTTTGLLPIIGRGFPVYRGGRGSSRGGRGS